MYYYQAPTGFPDKGAYWINAGSLLNRMNFGLALAEGQVPGVKVDLKDSAEAVGVAIGSPEYQQR
jgi:hypothetical protein